MLKRTISLLLALVMMFTAIPWTAMAEETQPDVTVQTEDIILEGTNGFGNLLSAEIVEAQEEQTEEYLGGYTVTDLVVEGNTATVTYDAMDEATLVVALYTEDGLQMLTSANTVVSPDETESTVTFSGEMPEYFLAKAFLVDSVDISPLSQAYESPMYTRVMQELLNSTVEDYAPELVINFDEDPTTNFAVYNEGVVRVEEAPGVNTVVTNDDGNLLYVVENADETFTALQPGDVVSYFYGDEELLLAKVASVSVEGTTVTIHGDGDLEVEEVFDYVKVEQDGETSDFTATDLDPDDGIELGDDTGTAPVLYGNTDDDIYIKDIIPFTIVSKKWKNDDGTEVEASGNLSLELTLRAAYYKAKSYRYIRVKIDYSLGVHLIAEGKVKVTTAGFADIVLVNSGVFSIRLVPAFFFEVSGRIDLSATVDGSIGFVSESTRDEPISLNTNPKMVVEAEGKVTLSAGIDLQPVIAFIHDKLVSVVLSVPVAGVAELIFRSYSDNETSVTGEYSDYIHDCTNCLEGRFYFTIKIDISVNILSLDHTLKIQPFLTPEQKFYYSFDYEEGGSGSCPHKRYLVAFEVLREESEDGEMVHAPIEGAAITAADRVLHTDENGLARDYFSKGSIHVSVSAEGKTDSRNYNVRDAGQKLKLIFDGKELLFGYYVEDSVTENITDTSAAIDSGTCGDAVEWTFFGSGVLNIYGSGEMSRFNSASDVPWHKYRSSIRNVIISGDVTSVGRYAFYECSDLYGVFLCDTIVSIGNYAFYGCGFTWISLPESVETIGDSAFKNCRNLREIEIPGGVTSIPSYAFHYCTNLSKLKLTPRVTSIGSNAFGYCSKLESIEGMLSVESIGESAFANCAALPYISFSDNLWYIGANAFGGCTKLTAIEIPDSVTSLGTSSSDYYEQYKKAGTFANCTGLKTVFLGAGLKEIPGGVFSGCSALENVSIGGSVEKIGYEAFARCSALKAITLPASVKQIETYAFTYSGLKEIWFMGDAPTFVSDYSGTCQCFSGVTATAYYPGGNETWETGVRKSYKGSITWQPYTELTGGTLDTGVEWTLYPSGMMIISGNGGMYDYSGWTTPAEVPWHEYRDKITALTVENGVTSVGPRAFYQCANLTSISLPSTITNISDYAFTGCGITSISIPDSVTSIGAYAFNGTRLTNVLVPDQVRTIGKQAFYYCEQLKSVYIGDSVTQIGNNAFDQCSALKSVTGMNSLKIIGTYAFQQNIALSEITLPDTLETIDVGAFSQCDSLTSVHIPDSVTFIGGSAFYACDALEEVTIGNGVTSIGEYAFYGCSQMKEVTLGDALCVIYQNAFAFCSGLDQIVIPASVYDIEVSAFYGCSALKEVWFQGNAPEFGGSNVFHGATANAYYPSGNATWTSAVLQNYGGTITWIPYTPEAESEVLASGTLESGLSWSLRSSGEMVISGSGAMDNWTSAAEVPWYEVRDSIRNVKIEEGVTSIGNHAFDNCRSLASVSIPSGVVNIGNYAFYSCSALESVTGMQSVEIISAYAFKMCTSLTNISLPDTLSDIAYEAFRGCSSLAQINIPDSVTNIGQYSFYDCTGLTTVSVGDGVTQIGKFAFSRCFNLAYISLGESVRHIQEGAFGSTGLERFVFPASVVATGGEIFFGCYSLKEVFFEGNAPSCSRLLYGVTADAYYPAGNTTWTEEVMAEYSGTITWIPYTPGEAGGIGSGTVNTSEAASGSAPSLDAIYGGEYGSEDTGEYIRRTASFSGLVPNAEYVLLAMVSIDTTTPLAPDNLLYIDQAAAGADGTLSFTYVQRVTTDPSYVVACGAATKSLADATITFPDMVANGKLHAVDPTVVYDGVTLQEGRDYEITGTVSYTEAGTYVCYIRGIHNYTGTMKCTYTVSENPCAAGHTEEAIPGKDANCTEAGLTDGAKCAVCGEILAEQEEIPAKGHTFADGECTVCGAADPDYEEPTTPTDPEKPTDPTEPVVPEDPALDGVIRIAGADRIGTSLMLADQLKETLGVTKFDAVVVASALNFPDALTGSYLAAVKDAPILLTYPAAHEQITEYIVNNLASGGTVYILGGESAVDKDFENMVIAKGLTAKRVAGSDRFGTNLAIMQEAGNYAGKPVLIATALNFADSLSASAAGLPMVLVYGSLRPDQKEFLATTSRNFIIIGGTSAVSAELEAELKAIGTVERLAGAGRYQTSVMVAQKFVQNPDVVVLAYARNFPDGLCGGPLAYALGAPLILTDNYDPSAADAYVDGITAGIVVGGTGLISDASTRAIFDLAANTIIPAR